MACTIDHLRVDHRVKVLRDFTDLGGLRICAGEVGVLRGLGLDYTRMEIWIELERHGARERLRFALRATDGPRNGQMREFFELGEDVTAPRVPPIFHAASKREMIVRPLDEGAAPTNDTEWARTARTTEGPDRLEKLERDMLKAFDRIGVAASIAELYAERMRAFQRVGDEPRAAAAFKLAVGWMDSYASSATSGGEGAALSYESERFRKSLTLEFGYDPTAPTESPTS